MSAIKAIESGMLAEQAVRYFLDRRGFREVTHNYCVHRMGEVDIIVKRDETLYFVEVRMRRDQSSYGTSEDSIVPLKRKRVLTAANHFIQAYGLQSYYTEFWAAGVSVNTRERRVRIKMSPF
ncbi:MAG: YraN family protein [Clostridiaceae bacterium]|jgi:Holliday junction resolvase-like predicted endonuclease|nr:YraN family protein [Oscillospiraceae bacterium]NLO63005.1 YraN family protein [Clostridiaceae bacterium]